MKLWPGFRIGRVVALVRKVWNMETELGFRSVIVAIILVR